MSEGIKTRKGGNNGGNLDKLVVDSATITGYSLHEKLQEGTFVTKADKDTMLIDAPTLLNGSTYMITSTLGIYFWNNCTYNDTYSADKYDCYVRAFKVNSDNTIQMGTELKYLTGGLEYCSVLDAISISNNRLLGIRVYGTEQSYGQSMLSVNCKLVAQYFTVNNDLSITLSTELILKDSYSHAHEAIISKAPNGNIYVAFYKGGSYTSSYSSSDYYYLYICLLNVSGNAPTLTTTTKIVDTESYSPYKLIAFCVLSNTSAILHYNYDRYNSESAYCVAITLSGNNITKGTQTTVSASTVGFSYCYVLFKYNSSEAIGLTADGSYIALLTTTSRTKITCSQPLAWIGFIGSELYCLTQSGNVCKCSISGSTFTYGEIKATISCSPVQGASYTQGFVFTGDILALLPVSNSTRETFYFSEYLYRMGKTYKKSIERGTSFGITSGELLTTTPGNILTIKEG